MMACWFARHANDDSVHCCIAAYAAAQQELLQSRLADAQKQNEQAEQKHHRRLKEVVRRCGWKHLALPAT